MYDQNHEKCAVYICRTTRTSDEHAAGYDGGFFQKASNSASFSAHTGKVFTDPDNAIASVRGFPAPGGVWVIYKAIVPKEKLIKIENTQEFTFSPGFTVNVSDIEGLYAARVNDFGTFIENKQFESNQNSISHSNNSLTCTLS